MSQTLPIPAEAEALNQRLSPVLAALLSDLGRRAYFPAKGIPKQSQEAKALAHKSNATIGICLDDDGEPMGFAPAKRILEAAGMAPKKILSYPPALGLPEYRSAWQKRLIANSKGILEGRIGLPIPTFGITHAIGIMADLFLDEGDTLIVPDQFWGNIRLTATTRSKATIKTFPHFNSQGGFNVTAMKEALAAEAGCSKRILYLNAPNNPTGYTPSKKEADQIREALQQVAADQTPTLIISDEAYFGFFFDDQTIDRHLVSYMADLPKSMIPVLVSGPTKELCVWGVRAGFITFIDLAPEDLEVLEAKISGMMRAYNSFGSALIQSFITNIMEANDFHQEEARVRAKLRERGLAAHQEAFKSEYLRSWTPYPFNSGYFCLVKLAKGLDANSVRLRLLADEGVGTIAVGKDNLRVAFSSTPTKDLPEVFASIDRVVQAMLSGEPSSPN